MIVYMGLGTQVTTCMIHLAEQLPMMFRAVESDEYLLLLVHTCCMPHAFLSFGTLLPLVLQAIPGHMSVQYTFLANRH